MNLLGQVLGNLHSAHIPAGYAPCNTQRNGIHFCIQMAAEERSCCIVMVALFVGLQVVFLFQ